MRVTRISAAAGVILSEELAHQAHAVIGYDLPLRSSSSGDAAATWRLGTAVGGVDDDAPVDAQNAPTGACKTAPNQNAVSHTVHTLHPF
jgi:hypothetical protein